MKFDFSSDTRASCLIFIMGIFSLCIIMNRGYFSHDEISWGLKTIYSSNFNFSHFYLEIIFMIVLLTLIYELRDNANV